MLLTLPSEGPEREAQRREKQRIAVREASKCVTHLKVRGNNTGHIPR